MISSVGGGAEQIIVGVVEGHGQRRDWTWAAVREKPLRERERGKSKEERERRCSHQRAAALTASGERLKFNFSFSFLRPRLSLK